MCSSVPDGHLGVQATDGIGICLSQLGVDSLLDHEVLDEASRAAEGGRHISIGVCHGGHTSSFLLLPNEIRLCLFGSGKVLRLSVDSGLVGVSVGCLLLRVVGGIRASLLLIVLSISCLLLCFLQNSRLDDIAGSEPLELSLSTPGLDIFPELFVAGLGGTVCLDLNDANVPVVLRLAGRESGLCFGFLAVSLGLLDCCLCIDLCDFSVLFSNTLSFSDITSALGFSDIDTGLCKEYVPPFSPLSNCTNIFSVSKIQHPARGL